VVQPDADAQHESAEVARFLEATRKFPDARARRLLACRVEQAR
jgi:hypothetical protein